MAWLAQWRMRRAARQYARLLGPHLQRAYGAAEHYTAAQIVTAVGKLGLNADFIALGFAAYLTDDAFAALVSQMPIYIPYTEARDLLARYRPPALSGSGHFYESGIGMTGTNP